MKILQVSNSFKHAWGTGGVARVAYDISLELTKRGHKVTVFTTDRGLDGLHNVAKNRPILIDGITVYYFKNLSNTLAKKGITIPYFSPLVIAREIQQFDLIHIHEPKRLINILIYYYAKKYHIPYVFQAHGDLPQSLGFNKQFLTYIFYLIFTRKLLRNASMVIALADTERQLYLNNGVREENIKTIPNGIHISEYTDLPPKGLFRKKFGIDKSKKIILYLGRVHKNKGIDFLVKAYFYLINNMACKDTLLIIAGSDSGYMVEIKKLVNNLEIADKVNFIGPLSQTDKIAAYVDSTVVVNVEPNNVYGLVPIEAASCATPVIISEGNAISQIISQGKFGFSVKYGDVKQLSEIMQRIVNNESVSKKLGLNGRKFILENYNWANILLKLESVYMEVTKEPRDAVIAL